MSQGTATTPGFASPGEVRTTRNSRYVDLYIGSSGMMVSTYQSSGLSYVKIADAKPRPPAWRIDATEDTQFPQSFSSYTPVIGIPGLTISTIHDAKRQGTQVTFSLVIPILALGIPVVFKLRRLLKRKRAGTGFEVISQSPAPADKGLGSG